MEAPEKLYYGFNEQAHLEAYCLKKTKLCQIEYIRTDAFIENALRWMISKGGVNDTLSGEMIEDFKKYMKGE